MAWCAALLRLGQVKLVAASGTSAQVFTGVFLMNKAKVIVAAVLTVLLAIIIIQNAQPAETQILFFTITAPRAVLLFSTLVIGFVVGILVAGFGSRKKA